MFTIGFLIAIPLLAYVISQEMSGSSEGTERLSESSVDRVGQPPTVLVETEPVKHYPGGGPLKSSSIEEWVLIYSNEEREEAGLVPLTHDQAISDIARSHSRAMTQFGLHHDIHGMDPTDRALAAGYDCRAYHEDGSYSYGLSENIFEYPRVTQWLNFNWNDARPNAYDRDSQGVARGLVTGWMESPGHRDNLLDEDARRIGVGVAIREDEYGEWISEVVFATQNFSSCRE